MKKVIDYKTNYGSIKFDIKSIMDKRGITIYELSRRVGIKYDIIKNYYNASNYAYNLDTLARICYVLECNLTDLMEYCYESVPINGN